MKYPIYLTSLVLSFVLVLSCKSSVIQDQWAAEPINIDGNYSEWPDSSLYYIENSNIMIGSKNDTENLYVMLRFGNPLMARKISMFGVTIWLEAKEKKNKDYGLHYNGSVRLNQNLDSQIDSAGNFSQERMERMNKRRSIRPEPGMITFINNGEKLSFPEKNGKGPSAASDFQNGLYCYELQIPLPAHTMSASELSLGIELGGISTEEISAMQQRQEPGGTRGGYGGMKGGHSPRGHEGGRGGQEMGGRESGGARSARGELFQKQEEWVNILLAQKK